ncbi:MAG: Pr6Pr family membrane protein [Paracoccaceae bacterium]|nr:MAG: Pr6Pr family membrane protein [Paracoccaceae bacterium]
MSATARLSALVLCLVAALSLVLRFRLSLAAENGDVVATVWRMAGFFTVLTNALVAAHMAAVAAGWRIGASRAAGLLLAIGAVGIVYHLLLAGLWSPQGAAWWADQGLHTAVPVGMALWWAIFAPKGLAWRDLPEWLVYPVVYGVYAVARGIATGFWPYPFLNADKLGWPAVAGNLAGMVLAFAVLGAAILLAARGLSRQPVLVQ